VQTLGYDYLSFEREGRNTVHEEFLSRDIIVIDNLRLADADARSLADMIFNAGSVLSTLSPAAAVRADCKQYREGERRFSVSQVEELGFTNFWKCEDALLEALETYRKENGLNFSCLLVTDIDTQSSLFLIRGDAEVVQAITYPQKRPPDIFDLPGIVSRKKQLMPYLGSLLGGTNESA